MIGLIACGVRPKPQNPNPKPLLTGSIVRGMSDGVFLHGELVLLDDCHTRCERMGERMRAGEGRAEREG